MPANFDIVSTKNDLRNLDDSEAADGRACIIEGYSWYFLDRDGAEADDGDGYITPLSGNGRWKIMTPQTACIAASFIEEYAMLVG